MLIQSGYRCGAEWIIHQFIKYKARDTDLLYWTLYTYITSPFNDGKQ